MTNTELDRTLRQVLLDALRLDESQTPQAAVPFVPSRSYRRSMSRICKNPLKWLRERERPVWRRVAQQAAVILLVISLGFGCVMATVPSARAAVMRWVTEWYETHIVYRYSDEAVPEQVPKYTITALPDGFVEVDRTVLSQLTDIAYADDDGNIVSFSYSVMHQGGIRSFDTTGSVITEVAVNGAPGQFFETKVSGEFNTLTWVDEGKNLQFVISGCFEQADLLCMAESISVKK